MSWIRVVNWEGNELVVRSELIGHVYFCRASADGSWPDNAQVYHVDGKDLAVVTDPEGIAKLREVVKERPMIVWEDAYLGPDETPNQMRERIRERLTTQGQGPIQWSGPLAEAVSDEP